ncbi:hypothetical protein BDZ45DRAFT_781511 [Acephala macrosclerotiorum]|nr:hypothetical protein BDZ45DRAFT_781511 [Acephala macrosclerotiorum]
MSGVEILGVLASAGQVAEYGLYFIALLSTTYQKIKNAPGAIEQHTKQINQLLSITESIQQTSCQQDPIVFTHINSIHLEAKELAAILNRTSEQYSRKSVSAYWQVIKGSKEKQIVAIFEKLEKAKSGLTLCLASHNADSLRIIQNSVKRIEGAMARPTVPRFMGTEEGGDSKSEDEGNKVKPLRREFGDAPSFSRIHEERAMVSSTSRHLQTAEQRSGTDGTPRKHKRRTKHEAPASNLSSPRVEEIQYYVEDNKLFNKAVLINGPQFVGFNNLPAPSSSHKSMIKNNHGEGTSMAINGPQVIAPSRSTRRPFKFPSAWLWSITVKGRKHHK